MADTLGIPESSGSQVMSATPPTWPLSLVLPIAATLVLLAVFTSLELPSYVHAPSVPAGTSWVVFFSYVLIVWLWMFVETRSTWYAGTAVDQPRIWFRRHLRRLPLFVVCFVALGFVLRLAGFALVGFEFNPYFQFVVGLIVGYESFKAALLYCCWLGLAFGLQSFLRMRRQTEQLLTAQKTLAEAKLAHLQGQLRPHFLFNTLNTISALMQVDVGRADRLLTQLGDLLRANLNASDRSTVALREELQLLAQYATIMQERFVGRVTVEWDIEDTATQASVPTMLLQPLLENAFKHGVERHAGEDRIRIEARRRGETLVVTIHNANSSLDGGAEGWGLSNSRERLKVLYGDSASLTLTQDGGVRATVTLPWSTAS